MTERDDTTLLRTWMWVQRCSLLASSAGGALALTVILATDPNASGELVLITVVAGAVSAAIIGNILAGTVARSRGRPVRSPGSIVAAMVGIAALLGLSVALLLPRLGIHPQYPAATFIAIAPLLALVAFEIVYAVRMRSGD